IDITFKNVKYIYQPNSPFAHQTIDDLSFHIPSGSFVAVIGHTGSGKSTLIQHLNGLVLPTAGEVTIGDFYLTKDEKPKNMKELRSRDGVVFQYPEHQLFEETIEKDIAFGADNCDVPQDEIEKHIETIISEVELTKNFIKG